MAMRTGTGTGKTAGAAAILAALLAAPSGAFAAEGASSHFLPGTAGDIAIAASPAPGFLAANSLWIQSGNIGAAVLQGQVKFGLDLDLVLDLAAFTYTVEVPAIGGTYTLGALLPFGYATLDARLRGPAGGTIAVSDSSFNLSDIALIPLQLNWAVGDFSFKFAEIVIAPTGPYDLDETVNLGRNYWSFDTVAAVTWLDPGTGTEVSVAPGIMVNTTNDATDYRTGAEFHVDFTANQFLSETFAFGLRGYYYRQVTGDSGSGALLGDFKSESLGIGPGFLWTPAFAGGRLSVVGKWMHDVRARNRFKSDYGSIGVAWKF